MSNSRMPIRTLGKCQCGTYFIGNNCPECGNEAGQRVPFVEGDCVKCGALCSVAYCCATPFPMSNAVYDELTSYD